MRSLVRAAAYLPVGSAEGRRIAGPDEDVLTLLASAMERVLEPIVPPGEGVQIVLVGRLPENYDWALGALSHSSTPIVRSGEDGRSLAVALKGAWEGDGGPAVVLAAELPEREDRSSVPRSTIGSGSAAFLFRSGRCGDLQERLDKTQVVSSIIDTAFNFYRAETPSDPASWVGDWAANPSSGDPVDPQRIARVAGLVPSAVSEGAYVPRPRYLESLPSRWQLLANRCSRCSALTFPIRGFCRGCGGREGLSEVALPRDGALVVATTIIRKGGQPTEFDPQVEVEGPYQVVLAEPAPGVRVTFQLTDAAPGMVRIGDRVDTRLRRLYPMEGEWRYGRKAVPARRAQ
jgi:uncharacterized OB-fold protein